MKKFISIIAALIFLVSCSQVLFYNAKLEPLQEDLIKGSPIIFSGVYRQDLQFSGAAVEISGGQQSYRIIVINDLGIELFQAEIHKEAGNNLITKSVLSKKILNEFMDFFLSYFYGCIDGILEESDGKIYYKKNGKIIIWTVKQ
ncbi:MAG: hypothetical protein LBT79_05415 [Elusimicrobiota bacterium]|nr:hypothetical protein [Elusimicrobiota bacterium]